MINLNWLDRRPISMLHLSDGAWPGDWSKNPARWLFDHALDAMNPTLLRERFMAYADGSIAVMREMNAQGCIIEIDGARWPEAMYLGSPDTAVKNNPELAPFINSFFARFRSAGFLVGVYLRPHEFDPVTGWRDSPDPLGTLFRKIEYARRVWKCKLYYVDTNCWHVANWPILPAEFFGYLNRAFPGCLFIPEHEDTAYHRYTAPYRELRMGETQTPIEVRAAVPGAFSVIFTDGGNPRGYFDELTAAVRRGDILAANGWWRSPDVVATGEIWRAAQP